MNRPQRPIYPRNNFKTAEDWHIYFVYTDNEFIEEVEKINKKHRKWAEDSGEKHPSGIPKFPKSKKREANKDWKFICDKYAVSDSDITFFVQGGFGGGWDKKTMAMNDVNAKVEENMGFVYEEDGRMIVELESYITYQRYHDLWKNVLEHKKKLLTKPRRRAPESPKLIYAVFKARKKGLSFPELFRLYSSGKLPYFRGSTNQFKDEESLERYYDKYKPDTYR